MCAAEFSPGRIATVGFRCWYAHNKCQYFKAFNAIFYKVGRYASEGVVFMSSNDR